MSTNFDQLRRQARERGTRDADRSFDEYLRDKRMGVDTPRLERKNPFEGNHATDEREEWDQAFDETIADRKIEESNQGSAV